MTSVLIIGNSHTVPLRHAWSRLGEHHPRYRIEFFVAPAPIFKHLRFKGSKFGVPTGSGEKRRVTEMTQTLNGRTEIDISAFDRIVLAGFGDRFQVLANVMLDMDIDGLRETGAAQRLSRPAFDAICAHVAENALPPRLLQNLTIRPVILVERHRPAETCVDSDEARYQAWKGLAARPDGINAVLRAYSAIFADVLRKQGATLLPQPDETIVGIGLTAARFSEGSISLTSIARSAESPHPEIDHSHTNVAYGHICLSQIFDHLDATASSSLVA